MAGLDISIQDQIATIRINNSEAGNSFGLTEAKDLLKFLKSKEAREINGLLWTNSVGQGFCSGGNLKYYAKQKSRIEGIRVNRTISHALALLAEFEKPTIALVDGDCFGGGVELLSAFDFVLSTPKSFFGLWQRRISLTFGWGGGTRLDMRLGRKKLLQNAFLANSFSAFSAQEMGLVDSICYFEDGIDFASALFERSSRLPQAPVSKIKRWSPSKESKIFESLWMNKEHAAVLKKF